LELRKQSLKNGVEEKRESSIARLVYAKMGGNQSQENWEGGKDQTRNHLMNEVSFET